jgi:hypothetical protein
MARRTSRVFGRARECFAPPESWRLDCLAFQGAVPLRIIPALGLKKISRDGHCEELRTNRGVLPLVWAVLPITVECARSNWPPGTVGHLSSAFLVRVLKQRRLNLSSRLWISSLRSLPLVLEPHTSAPIPLPHQSGLRLWTSHGFSIYDFSSIHASAPSMEDRNKRTSSAEVGHPIQIQRFSFHRQNTQKICVRATNREISTKKRLFTEH